MMCRLYGSRNLCDRVSVIANEVKFRFSHSSLSSKGGTARM